MIDSSDFRTKRVPLNHGPAEASLDRLGLNYLDLYLSHTPFAFQPGDEQDPRDPSGNILYDREVNLLETWRAMESLVDHGKCRAIGLSDITLDGLLPIYESARIKPAVVQVEARRAPAPKAITQLHLLKGIRSCAMTSYPEPYFLTTSCPITRAPCAGSANSKAMTPSS
jgi:diketogulonate reductase-like aldo/keto reductase